MRALLASGRHGYRPPAITHQLPFEEFEHGMELMRDRPLRQSRLPTGLITLD